jgi:hypothetical protein
MSQWHRIGEWQASGQAYRGKPLELIRRVYGLKSDAANQKCWQENPQTRLYDFGQNSGQVAKLCQALPAKFPKSRIHKAHRRFRRPVAAPRRLYTQRAPNARRLLLFKL